MPAPQRCDGQARSAGPLRLYGLHWRSIARRAATTGETPSFAPDDQVMMSTLHPVPLGPNRKRKLTEKWQGPYRIIEMVGPNAAKLELRAGSRGHNVLNVSQLEGAHKSDPDKFPNRKDVSKPKPLFYSDGVPTFEVERLLAKGKCNKTWFVKIKWLGCGDEDENTWQPNGMFCPIPTLRQFLPTFWNLCFFGRPTQTKTKTQIKKTRLCPSKQEQLDVVHAWRAELQPMCSSIFQSSPAQCTR